MKAGKIAYWIATAALCLMYLAAATMNIFQRDVMRQELGALGYPAHLLPILLTVDLLGPAAILSRVSVALSDLAYAGMFFHLLLSVSAHLSAGDGGFAPAVVGLIALAASFLTQNVGRAKPSPYAPLAVAPVAGAW